MAKRRLVVVGASVVVLAGGFALGALAEDRRGVVRVRVVPAGIGAKAPPLPSTTTVTAAPTPAPAPDTPLVSLVPVPPPVSAVAQSPPAPAPRQPTKAGGRLCSAADLRLTIATDRSVYKAGEVVEMQSALTNVSRTPCSVPSEAAGAPCQPQMTMLGAFGVGLTGRPVTTLVLGPATGPCPPGQVLGPGQSITAVASLVVPATTPTGGRWTAAAKWSLASGVLTATVPVSVAPVAVPPAPH